MTLTIDIVDVSDPTTVIVTLSEPFNRRGRTELNEAAASSFALANTDADIADVQVGRVAVWRFDGEVAFAQLIEKAERQTIAQGEEHDQITTFVGRDVVALLARTVIEPSRGPDVLPVEVDRMFAWPSPEYDEVYDGSPWGSAVQIAQQSDTTTYWTGAPFDNGDATWADTTAYWIGSSTTDDDDAPLGVEYYRKVHTVATAGFYAVQFGAFYYGDVWIDGQHIASTGDQIGKVQQEVVELTAGDHTFAMVVQNIDNGGDNPAGAIFALHPVVPLDGSLGSVEMHSDSSWSMLAFPTLGQPGMTTGEILDPLLTRAQTVGDLPAAVTWDFTGTDDSNLDPWVGTDHPDVEAGTLFDCATKVGTDLLTFLQELAGSGYIDFWMDETLALHVVNAGGRGTASGVTLDGTNILSLRHITVAPVCNSALVAWTGGFHRVTDDALVATYGRVGGFLSLGAQQAIIAVEAVAGAELAIQGQPQTSIEVVHGDLGGWPYSPGDMLSVLDEDLAPIMERVRSVTASEDDNGTKTFQPTFGEPV